MSSVGCFVVDCVDQLIRLDLMLSRRFSKYSRTLISSFISSGRVLVNGNIVCKRYVPKIGDSVFFDFTQELKYTDIIPKNIPLDVIYEDSDLIILNKPKGMVVHPAPGHYDDTLVNALVFYTNSLSRINYFRPGIVHRLDRDTSGIMIVAKNNETHEKLASQIQMHKINRTYLGIVYGNFDKKFGKINLPIGRDVKNRQKMAVVYKNCKEAITNYEVINQFENFSFLKFRLETGRTHQIRVHMAHERHPLVGDVVYGNKIDPFNLSGQCLHSFQLEFDHPTTGNHLKFYSNIPIYFKNFLLKITSRVDNQ